MRRIGFSVALALALGAPFAPVSGTTLDYQGYGFETGGFPPSSPGDTLRIPIIVTGITPALGVDLGTEEVTGWISGLVSGGPQDGGDAVQFFTFSSGRMEIYRDPARDHDFGTLPPNATVPATFTNGDLCLAGDLTDFVLYLDTDSNTGAYEGNVVFDTGSCLETLHAIRAEGFTFGGVLTRQSVGGNTAPDGYDMSIDGYLEAQKIPEPETGCAFACMGFEEARLDFPRREPRNFGPKDGKFQIEGHFLPCTDGGELDPNALEVRVRIGSYVQVFPEGSLRPRHHDDHRSDMQWRFENERGTQTITELEIAREDHGKWEFDIEGRGIPRTTLLGEDNLLVVELTIGDQNGQTQATLVQKKHKLTFKTRHEPCESDDDDDDDDLRQAPPQGGITVAATPDLLVASPNPFNATTTVALRLTAAGPAQLRIFDVRGQLVRVLFSGALAAGEHRFHWNGLDAHGQAVASGVYVYRLDAPGIAASRKMVVAK